MAVAILLAIVALFAVNFLLWSSSKKTDRELVQMQQVFSETVQKSQSLSMLQEKKIKNLSAALTEAKIARRGALTDAALAAIEEAESLSSELETATGKLIENSPADRTALLRADMRERVDAAKNSLPSAPTITETEPGKGVQGRLIVFAALPGPDGQVLRENAEVTGVSDDKVAVKFPGGTATYVLTELHPGVAAYLPVDPLLVLPRKQWNAEVYRIQQTLNARRDERIAELREAIQTQIPPGK